MPRVFITGLGFITSIGNDAASVTQSLRELRHGMVRYAPFERDEIPIKVAAPVLDFSTEGDEPEDWKTPTRYRLRRDQLRSLSPNALYASCAMQQSRTRHRLQHRWHGAV